MTQLAIKSALLGRPTHKYWWLPLIVVLVAFAWVFYYLFAILPDALAYRHELQNLRLEAVDDVYLCTKGLVNDQFVTTRERHLSREETVEFLKLIEASEPHSPNHPQGGWTSFASISRRANPSLSFSIHVTDNDGVQIRLSSNGQDGDGWNYGTLRNDELAPFLDRMLRVHRND